MEKSIILKRQLYTPVSKIDKIRYTVRLTSGDRGQVAKVEDGHIVIERK